MVEIITLYLDRSDLVIAIEAFLKTKGYGVQYKDNKAQLEIKPDGCIVAAVSERYVI